MSAHLLREAAALMRERAEAAAKPWHCWGDQSLPERSGTEAWSADMHDYLGGEWGEHAASWHPAVALAVADWLDAEADRDQFTHLGEPIWIVTASALAVARAYLGRDS